MVEEYLQTLNEEELIALNISMTLLSIKVHQTNGYIKWIESLKQSEKK